MANIRHLFSLGERVKIGKRIELSGLSNLHKAYLSAIEFLQQQRIGLNRVLVVHILQSGGWRNFDAEPRCREIFQCDIEQLQSKPDSILCASSIVISSSVRRRPQKRIDQVAMSSVDLDAIKACLFCKFHAFLELLLHCLNVLQGHLFGSREFSISDVSDFLPDCKCRRRPQFLASVFERMSDSACVENLQENDSSLRMDCVDSLDPSLKLFAVVQASSS